MSNGITRSRAFSTTFRHKSGTMSISEGSHQYSRYIATYSHLCRLAHFVKHSSSCLVGGTKRTVEYFFWIVYTFIHQGRSKPSCHTRFVTSFDGTRGSQSSTYSIRQASFIYGHSYYSWLSKQGRTYIAALMSLLGHITE